MSGSSAVSAAQANINARAGLASAVPVLQPVGSPQILLNPSPASGPVSFTIVPRAVGLLRRLYVQMSASVFIPAGTTLTPSLFGPAAMISRVQLTDLNNLSRHDTQGYHFGLLASIRNRQPAGSAYLTDSPLGFGNIFGGGIAYPTGPIVGTGQTVIVKMVYEIPVAYMDGDYRGAIYLGTTQAQVNLTLTLNPLFFTPAAADGTDGVFSYTGTAPTLTNVTLKTTQDYLDQLPKNNDGSLALPWQDMSQVYQLLSTDNNGVTANSDFQIPFANLRTYQSAFALYNNGGIENAGSDVTSWKLESANLYRFFEVDPDLQSYRTRNAIGDDVPRGVYYFPFRSRPINTSDFGNTYLTMKPAVANTNAKVRTLWEYFSTAYTLAGSAS